MREGRRWGSGELLKMVEWRIDIMIILNDFTE